MTDNTTTIEALKVIRGKLAADRQALVWMCAEATDYKAAVEKLVSQQVKIEAIDRAIADEVRLAGQTLDSSAMVG